MTSVEFWPGNPSRNLCGSNTGGPTSRCATIVLLTLALCGCSKKPAANAEADRDKQFQTMMSGVTLVGQSTRDNKPGVAPGEERYRIDKVSHLTGDTWLFQSSIKYGSTDVPVPVPVTIKWAGDTPVITLTDLTIPGVGTYTARVLLYRDRYAGTWSGKKGGGTMFGKIIRNGQQ